MLTRIGMWRHTGRRDVWRLMRHMCSDVETHGVLGCVETHEAHTRTRTHTHTHTHTHVCVGMSRHMMCGDSYCIGMWRHIGHMKTRIIEGRGDA